MQASSGNSVGASGDWRSGDLKFKENKDHRFEGLAILWGPYLCFVSDRDDIYSV